MRWGEKERESNGSSFVKFTGDQGREPKSLSIVICVQLCTSHSGPCKVILINFAKEQPKQ